MRRHHHLLIAAGLLAFPACGPKEIKYDVKIVTSTCDPKVDPFMGVKFLRVRVSGDGIDAPLETVGPTSGEHSLKVPSIPAGKNRILEVRGFDNDPTAGGKVLSVGKSLPFEVLDTIDPAMNEPIAISIFLRKVNAFTPPSSAATPKECARMKLPRAGHSATLLKNGKVYVAGGYNYSMGNPAVKVALSETELFNPSTNTFETAKEMLTAGGMQKLPKAFHSATFLPKSGQVLLWGGESYTGNNTEAPSAIILIYDAETNDYGVALQRKAPEPAPIARTQHRAMVDKNGKVLAIGGLTRTATLSAVNEVEYFNPETNEYKVVSGVQLPRVAPALAAVKGGDLIAVAGGTDGTAMKDEVVFFKWNGTSFNREMLANPPRLMPGRRGAAAATLRDGLDLLVLGGYSDPDVTKVTPLASSEIVGTTSTMVSPGPSVGSSGPNGRGDICTVQLLDGSVLAIGGQTNDIAGAPGRSDGSTLVVKSTGSGAASGTAGPELAVPRFQHTCTLLQDGSVLVLGGKNKQVAIDEILQDAWIFQPAPTDP